MNEVDNDIDPNGDEMEILEITRYPYFGDVYINSDSTWYILQIPTFWGKIIGNIQ
ncbi:MAG: hypothetical protein R2764_12145 [Bacteroidales bacterium]